MLGDESNEMPVLPLFKNISRLSGLVGMVWGNDIDDEELP